MTTRQYVSVLIIRVSADGPQLLMGRRTDGRYLGGTWQLITGSIEPGETAWQAALREVDEETRLPARELYRLSQMTHFYRVDVDAVCTVPLFCVLTDAAAEPATDAEHTELDWLPFDVAADRLMWPGDRTALAEVQSEILANGPAKPYLRIPLPDPKSSADAPL